MKDQETSSRTRIRTKQKSNSISEIQHQPLRVSFSLLSLLQNQDNQGILSKNELQTQKLKLQQIQTQYNQQYKKNARKLKHIIEQDHRPKQKRYFGNITNKFKGQYFCNAQILTPKPIKETSLSNKNLSTSSKKKISRNSNSCKKQNKPNIMSFQKIQQGKKQFNIKITREQKGENSKSINFKYIHSPLQRYNSPLIKNNTKKQINTKRSKQILVVCHKQNKKCPMDLIKKYNKKSFNLKQKQNIQQKNTMQKIVSSSKLCGKQHKPVKLYKSRQLRSSNNSCSSKQLKNKQNNPKNQINNQRLGDYWGNGFQIVSPTKKVQKCKSIKNLPLKLL